MPPNGRASLVLVGQSRDRLRRRLFGAGVAARLLLRESHGLEINVLDRDDAAASTAVGGAAGVVWRHYRCWR